MRLIVTAGLAAGSLLLGLGAFAVPAQAELPQDAAQSRAKPLARGSFKTKNGSAKAFKNIEASGTYEVTLDKITVRFKVKDKKKDGWTPAVQFAALEAWDGEGTGLYFPLAKNLRNGRGTPTPNQSSTIDGPPISNTVKPKNEGRPSCRTCNNVKPKPKPKPKKGPADGKFTFKFKKAFTTKYTEYLAVREVLLRKKGKKYQYKVGPTTIIYAASEGPQYAPAPSDARTTGSNGLSVQRRVTTNNDYQEALRKGLSGTTSARRAIPKGWTHFTNKKVPGQLDASTETWGYFTGYKNDSGGTNARLTLRIRDNAKDKRYAGTIVAFTNDDASLADEWTLSNLQDVKGRWTSRVIHSQYSGHLLYQSCVGLYSTVDGQKVFNPTTCGEIQVLY